MFFLANGKYLLTRKNIFFFGGRGEFSITVTAENCRNKIFYLFKHIFFLHIQETICLEKNIAPLKLSVP
jgi:hypothetical protein